MSDKSMGAVAPHRWWQLIAGIICMVMIANLQYGWTLFVRPMNQAHGWAIADIQIAFSIFIALETWLTPIEGWLVDTIGRGGPKLVVAFGGILVADRLDHQFARPTSSRCCMSARRSPASAPARSTPPASATR